MKRMRWIIPAVIALLAVFCFYFLIDRNPGDNGNYPPEPDGPVFCAGNEPQALCRMRQQG